MITYQYTQKDWTTFKEGIKREWAVTNGIGGYAGSSMIGAHSRTHQGYLIASLHAPIERYLVFSKINETATVGTSTVSFETSQHCASGKTVYTEGQKFLTSFIYDGSVHYTYETDNFSFEKHITLKRNANVCAVAYELTAGDSDCTFTLTPLFNYREHSESSTPDTLKFETFTEDRTFYLVPEKNKDIAIRFQTSEGTFSERETVYDIDMQLQIEVDLETDGLDCHYCPVDLSIAVPANTTKKVSILCSIGDVNERPAPVSGTEAFSILEENARCHAEMLEQAGPVILEPVGDLQVTVPDGLVGDVMGDLNKRRGSVMGMEPAAHKGYTTIQAIAPKVELLDYPITLRAMTQGRGSFDFAVTGYDTVPANLAAKIIEENKQQG